LEIREYRPEDCSEMASLFYDTVHTVNAADYTKEQLDAWADGAVDCEAWDHSFREHYTLVAIEDGKLAWMRVDILTGFIYIRTFRKEE